MHPTMRMMIEHLCFTKAWSDESFFLLYILKTLMVPVKRTATIKDLIEKGFLQPSKRGRPSLYLDDEERKAVHRSQQKACVKRHAAKVKEARQHMLESESDVSSVVPL